MPVFQILRRKEEKESDGYYFGTITELLVLPEYQKHGVGGKLLQLAKDHTPTMLYFGSQPGIEGFYEKNGCQKIKITERPFMNKEYLQYLIDTITDKDNLKKVKEEAIKLSNSYSPEEYP